jgi:hypothetical protein
MTAKTCPHNKACPLFAKFQVQSFLRIWQMNYCQADYSRCARFVLRSQGKQVPVNLLPNGREVAGLDGPGWD